MILRMAHSPFGFNGLLIGSSDKSRIPAWCDRVLRRGDNLRQISYTTAPLRFSDHRPVFATFQCSVIHFDELVKESLSHDIYTKRKSDVGKTTTDTRDDAVDDEDLIGYESIAPELPPASSDRRKWWLDNGGKLLYMYVPVSQSAVDLDQ